MDVRELSPEGRKALEQVLGYLNFSSGNPDVQFLGNLNLLFGLAPRDAATPAAQVVADLLRGSLPVLAKESAVLRDSEQVRSVLDLVFEHVLPGYLAFHRDLLFHQTGATMFNSFFVGRVCEAVLREGGPWDEIPRITRGAIKRLNDYVGYRPVAQLERKKAEPYPHEWVRPVPLYVRGAGVAVGPHQRVIEQAIRLLEETDEALLRAACFEPAMLDEMAFDPRAYDFDHPVNKRPNYHFGQWDPHHIDNQGRYRRYVVQQVTLDALTCRLNDPHDAPHEELVLEAASVLAGTILMASGVCGWGPEAHDSTVTAATLLAQIARYRDEFYEQLLQKLPPRHRERLQAESKERRQPFGAARQHLNAQLARRRASQLEHVQLARIFARMGYPEAAARQANVVPTASARMMCQIHCWVTEANLLIDKGQLDAASRLPAKIRDLLMRGIDCGAVIDPWNILGFDCQFSLLPNVENSVIDHRVEELVDLMHCNFAIYSRIWSDAAARDNEPLSTRISGEFQDLCEWWRKFAAHEVTSIEAIDALDAYRAAEHVANALNLWHKGGAATGDVAFWAPHANLFDSPKGYALVVDALLARGDFVASMALLMHWLGQGETIPLEKGDSSFYELAERWLLMVRRTAEESESAVQKAWGMIRKFFDFLEANADTFWQIPQLELGVAGSRPKPAARDDDLETGLDDDEDEQNEVFSAAYEDVVYQDSTDDGFEGSVFDSGETTDDELERESRRIEERLAFLSCLARLWRYAAVSTRPGVTQADAIPVMRRWAEQSSENRRGLMELLDTVRDYRLVAPSTEHAAMVEYDRRRLIKESLLERIIATCVETANSGRLLLAVAAASVRSVAMAEAELKPAISHLDETERLAIDVFSALFRRDVPRVRHRWQPLLQSLGRKPLLYVPLSKGGQPRDIVAARIRQHMIQDLLMWLPRSGLILETCRLVETARQMEQNNPVGPGAVTEFDELFKIGCRALVENLIHSAQSWPEMQDATDDEHPLVESLEQLTEAVLVSWLAHSRTLRLSVLERVVDNERDWKRLVSFIKRYGDEIFTQRFLTLGNVRAIMHQGVDSWLRQIEAEPSPELQFRLLDELDQDKGIPREEAVEMLSLALEAVIENYGEYRDYNSTTTQSDRGEMLYTLLDFLRLRSKYDRVCWNLKPVILAHDTLLRHGETTAARIWRGALTERVSPESDQYLSELAKLQKKYAMRMPTVADRLAERFIRPMAIDSIRALVGSAIEEAIAGGPCPHFELLEREAEALAREPTGVGLDVPAWIVALQEEVERARRPAYEKDLETDLAAMIPPVPLSLDETIRQLEEWGREK